MSEKIEKTSGDQSEGKESNNLDQDDISKLIDEIQGEENSSEMENRVEKTTDDETKQESDEKTDDESEGKESNTINRDDVSKLIDEVQTEAKSPEVEEKEVTTEYVEKDNEGEKNAESEMTKDKIMQTAASNDDVKEKNIEEKAESQEHDGKSVEEDEKSEKETDEKDKKEENYDEDKDSYEGLDSDDEIEIDGDPDIKKDKSDNEDNDNKSKKNDEDKDKESKKDADGGQAVILKEVKKRSKRKRFKLLISCTLCLVFIAVLFGAYAFLKQSGAEIRKAEKPFQPEQIAKPGNKYSEEQTRQQIKVYETKDIILSDSKQNNKINSFSVAIKNKKIEFGMMTIQRRQAYIKKVDPPYKWLNQGIEELLYLKHKIEIDAQVSSVISGIDMDKMIQEIDIVIQNYRTGIEELEIDMKNIERISLEMIWKMIIDKEKFTAGNNNKTAVGNK
jgi:hypothetical protein